MSDYHKFLPELEFDENGNGVPTSSLTTEDYAELGDAYDGMTHQFDVDGDIAELKEERLATTMPVEKELHIKLVKHLPKLKKFENMLMENKNKIMDIVHNILEAPNRNYRKQDYEYLRSITKNPEEYRYFLNEESKKGYKTLEEIEKENPYYSISSPSDAGAQYSYGTNSRVVDTPVLGGNKPRRPVEYEDYEPVRRPTRRPVEADYEPVRRPVRRPVEEDYEPVRRPTRRPVEEDYEPVKRPVKKPVVEDPEYDEFDSVYDLNRKPTRQEVNRVVKDIDKIKSNNSLSQKVLTELAETGGWFWKNKAVLLPLIAGIVSLFPRKEAIKAGGRQHISRLFNQGVRAGSYNYILSLRDLNKFPVEDIIRYVDHLMNDYKENKDTMTKGDKKYIERAELLEHRRKKENPKRTNLKSSEREKWAEEYFNKVGKFGEAFKKTNLFNRYKPNKKLPPVEENMDDLIKLYGGRKMLTTGNQEGEPNFTPDMDSKMVYSTGFRGGMKKRVSTRKNNVRF
jgi:hypothetical protein